jgi:nitronate monooxygenase
VSARFQTAVCDLLGIEHPILQSGMGRIAGPELVAKVCNAGGLGILAGLHLPPAELRRQIAQVRALTERPFGVNLWLHEALQPPTPVATLDERELAAVQAVLNRFRERLGAPAVHARPAPVPDLIDEAFEVILEERVPVFSVGLGDPERERSDRCHERGIRVIAMAATVADAKILEASGVDAIVAQGAEAGGHRSTWIKPATRDAACIGTIALVPQVVDSVRVPVIAAGGIVDGRGLVAALALGAQAVMLGTRFVATQESMAPAFFKQALLERNSDQTLVTDVYTGLYARGLRNRFAEEYEASRTGVLPPLVQSNAAQDVYAAALRKGDGDYYPMLAGQACGSIADTPSAADVVRAIMAEAERVRA